MRIIEVKVGISSLLETSVGMTVESQYYNITSLLACSSLNLQLSDNPIGVTAG